MKRKIVLWGGAALVLVLLLAAAAARNARPEKPAPARPDFDVGIPTAQEVRAMLGAYGQRVETTERELAGLKGELAETRKQLKESIDALGAERRRDRGAIEEFLRAPKETAPVPKGPRFRTFEFEKAAPRGMVLPAGSFGEATLLTGVYAPTGGDSLPVLLRLDAALIGPNRTRIPLQDAFLVGKAQGDANSKRAVVQLETLSFGTTETKVNGWVVDGDGVQGLEGTYVWRADEILALSGLTSGLSAGAEALAAREALSQLGPVGTVVTAITGDPLRFAGHKALGGAMGKMSEIIGARLQEVVPAIYVPNGRRVTVAFVSGVATEVRRDKATEARRLGGEE
jgi:hypothetical protein